MHEKYSDNCTADIEIIPSTEIDIRFSMQK